MLPGGRTLFNLLGLEENSTTESGLNVTSGSELVFEVTEDMTTEQAIQLIALAVEDA